MMDEIELLARAWIVCDQNDPISREDSTMNGEPEWKWFVPRAEATLKFIKDNGYKLLPPPPKLPGSP